jgi:hypothetical protein
MEGCFCGLPLKSGGVITLSFQEILVNFGYKEGWDDKSRISAHLRLWQWLTWLPLGRGLLYKHKGMMSGGHQLAWGHDGGLLISTGINGWWVEEISLLEVMMMTYPHLQAQRGDEQRRLVHMRSWWCSTFPYKHKGIMSGGAQLAWGHGDDLLITASMRDDEPMGSAHMRLWW